MRFPVGVRRFRQQIDTVEVLVGTLVSKKNIMGACLPQFLTGAIFDEDFYNIFR